MSADVASQLAMAELAYPDVGATNGGSDDVSAETPCARFHKPLTVSHTDSCEGETVDYREINRKVIEQFRAGGEIQGMHRDRLVLLTTTGAKTGQPRTTPMMFHREGDRLLVIASNAGAPRDPQWFGNLVREPRVTVEVGEEKYGALATVLTGAERERTWAVLTEAYPFFADHERQAGRTIPVVALARVPDAR